MATSLEISKKRGPDRSSTPKTLSFDVKVAKIGPADPEIICLREITEVKIYSPSGKFAKRAKKKIEITVGKTYSPFGNFCRAG